MAICFCFLTASGGAIFSEKLENKIKAYRAPIRVSYLFEPVESLPSLGRTDLGGGVKKDAAASARSSPAGAT